MKIADMLLTISAKNPDDLSLVIVTCNNKIEIEGFESVKKFYKFMFRELKIYSSAELVGLEIDPSTLRINKLNFLESITINRKTFNLVDGR